MAVKEVTVEISHTFSVDIPENLLEEVNEEELNEFLYDAFKSDGEWFFDSLYIGE